MVSRPLLEAHLGSRRPENEQEGRQWGTGTQMGREGRT